MSQLPQVKPDERRAYLADNSQKVKRRIAAMLGRTEEDDVPRRIRAAREGYSKTLLRYRPKTYAGKLTLLVSEEFHKQYLTTGWANLASGGVELHIVPGDHNSYIREHGHAAARHLAACLNQVQGR